MTSFTFYIIVFLSLATRSIDGSHLSLSASKLLVNHYRDFINGIRDQLTKNTSKLYDIPVLKNSLPSTERFTTINLNNQNNETIDLAIDKVNLGVLGYRSENTSYFFFDAPKESFDIVFPSTRHVLLRFNSNYESLEKASGTRRLQTHLGLHPLHSAISNLFHYNQKSVPESFLVILQMVLEAVKFKFIEETVINSVKYGYNFKPSLAFVSLEDNWAKLSSQIQASPSLQGLFNEAIKLHDSSNGIIPVDSIYYPNIITNIALQLFQCNVSTNFIRMIVDNDPCYVQPRTSSISGREGFCVDATRGLIRDGSPVILYPCGPQLNQKWAFQRDGTIRYSEKCLTFNDEHYVVIYNCSKVEPSTIIWNVSIDGTISNPRSGLVLTANASTRGTKLKVEANKFTTGQGWRVGNYVRPIIVSIIGMEELCLEATNNNTDVWLVNCVKNKAEQYWAVYSDGSIRVNKNRNLCVSAPSNLKLGLITLVECNGVSYQRWNFLADGSILNPKTRMVVDVEHAVVPLKRIILYPKRGRLNQKWALSY